MRTLKAKWAGTCQECGRTFPAGETIAWTGQPWHVACLETVLAKQKAEDDERDAHQREWHAKLLAGLLVRSTVVGNEIRVTGAPDAKTARAEADAFIASVRCAGGRARLLAHTRAGKRYVGREVVSYCGLSTLGYHEGWAFRFWVDSPSQA